MNVIAVVAALAAIASGAVAAYEALLMAMLARPMAVFLLVLQAFDAS